MPPDLLRALAGDLLPKAPSRVLLPGCGSAYELAGLLAHGYDACAVDISPHAANRARTLPGVGAQHVRLADVFALSLDPAWRGQFDWIYERAFVCALPARLWPAWASATAALCRPGGTLAGVFHLDPTVAAVPRLSRRGPPFAMTDAELSALLSPAFECQHAHAVADEDSIPVFRGKEWWMEWRRRG